MDRWERFSETKLQHKRMFYSSLSDEHIMQKKKVGKCLSANIWGIIMICISKRAFAS